VALACVQTDSPVYTVFAKQLKHHDPVDDGYASFKRFVGQHGLLFLSAIFKVTGIGILGVEMPGEFEFSLILHGNAPAVPQFDDVICVFKPDPGLFQVLQSRPHLPFSQFFDNRHKVGSVNLRDITDKMIIPKSARSAG